MKHEELRKPKQQTAHTLLTKAYDALEEHSAEICEPNVDHIQKLVWDAMQLLTKRRTTMTTINVQLTEDQIRALIELGDYKWINSDYADTRDTLEKALEAATPVKSEYLVSCEFVLSAHSTEEASWLFRERVASGVAQVGVQERVGEQFHDHVGVRPKEK